MSKIADNLEEEKVKRNEELDEEYCSNEKCVLGHDCTSSCQNTIDCPCLDNHPQSKEEDEAYQESVCGICKGFGTILEQDADNVIERDCICKLQEKADQKSNERDN